MLPHMFDKFVKAPTPTATRDGGEGTGLGLAIAKGIMEAHGGSIAAESPVADGRGTRFMLTFPRRRPPRMTAKTRVLVVDDEAAILRFLKPALEANDYEMTSAGTVAEAMKRIAADSPDIVLLDLGLPDGDGKDVIRRAREWSDVPIIVLSAREREAEKIEALDLGADDYVNKPFNVGELMARMRTALRHRMQRKAEIPVLRVGNLKSMPCAIVRHAGAEIKLTPKEFELLSFLARHAGRVVTHKQILTAVGAGAYRGYAISARLCRPVAAEDRRTSGRSPLCSDRTGDWISNCGELTTLPVLKLGMSLSRSPFYP